MADDEAPGVPEWVVTYGDMMSLLLTFFIMLVSLSEVVADEKYRAVMEALHRYLGYSMAPAAPAGKTYPLNSLVARRETLGSFHNPLDKEKRVTAVIRVQPSARVELRCVSTTAGTLIPLV